MQRFRIVNSLLMIAGVLAAGASADAASIIGNLSSTNDGAAANIGQGLTAQATFTMGTSSFSLTDAIVRLTLQAPLSDAPLLEILNSSNAVVETFTTPTSLPTGTNPITFLPSTPFTFQAGTTYKLFLTSSMLLGATFQWTGNNTPVTPTGVGATFVSSSASNGSQGPLSFEIDGTSVVPEPSSLLMGGLGGLMVMGFLRGRRYWASR